MTHENREGRDQDAELAKLAGQAHAAVMRFMRGEKARICIPRRDDDDDEVLFRLLNAFEAIISDRDRLRAALVEISDNLDCYQPCQPEPGCAACGKRPQERWCAGCVARRAMEST